jgi:hypothetical protein
MPKILTSAAAVLALLLTLSCSSSDSDSSPTASPSPSPTINTSIAIPDEKLGDMVLPLSEYPPEAQVFRARDDNGLLTLDEVANEDFDPDQQRAQLQSAGWSSGYDAAYAYSSSDAGSASQGLFFVDSEVDVFATAEGASAMIQQEKADLPEEIGKSSDTSIVTDATLFQADIGDEATGAHVTVTTHLSDGSLRTFKQIGIIFRSGRVAGSVSLATFSTTNAAVASLDLACLALARKFKDRIATAMAQLPASS